MTLTDEIIDDAFLADLADSHTRQGPASEGRPVRRSVTVPTSSTRCPASGLPAPPAVAGPSLWARLAHAIADEYRARRALRKLRGLNERMLHDIGLAPGGLEHAARFGRD